MRFRVVSDEDRVVDYLGTFVAGEPQEFTEEEAAWFERSKGVKLLQTNVPDGVEVTIVLTDDEKKDEEE